MATQHIARRANLLPETSGGKANAAPIRVDSDDNILKIVPGGAGSVTEVQVIDASSTQTLTNKTLTSPTISSPTVSGTITSTAVVNGPAPVNATGTTLAVAAATHAGLTVTLNRAAGITVTLPAATGTGNRYRFEVGTTVTSNQHRFNVTGDDSMQGIAYMHDEDTAAVSAFRASGDADQMDLNGGTKGGVIGDVVEFEDVATDKWAVTAFLAVLAGSNPATPFATGQVS